MINPGLHNDPARAVICMSSTGLGPTTQFHLSSGQTLFPFKTVSNVQDKLTTNLFLVPARYQQEAVNAGLVVAGDLPQGDSSELITRQGTVGDWFYSQDNSRLNYYLTISTKYGITKNGWYYGSIDDCENIAADLIIAPKT